MASTREIWDPRSMPADPTPEEFVFNPFVDGFDQDPAPVYHELRTRAPVYFWPLADAYLVSRYQDILAVLKDPRLSRSYRDSARYQPLPDLPEYREYQSATAHGLFQSKPADHLRLRRLVNPAFTPRASERLRGQIRDITLAALARLPDDEVVDLAAMVDDIPLRVIGRLLAIPDAMEAGFLVFARARLLMINPGLTFEERDELIRSLAPGYHDIRTLIAERRRQPGDDLLSTLVHLEEEGGRLSEAELIGMVESIIIGGADTTVHTLRFMLLNLLRNPEQLARVRAEPGLARAAMEETLRFDHFNKFGSPSFVLEDLTIGGVPVPRGSTVICMKGAASRDPELFARPDEFDLLRPDLGEAHNFGHGPHSCLGAHLARLEAEVILATIFEQLPGLTLAGPPEFTPHLFFRVMSRLPVRRG
jgi:cytochrome P450